MNMKVNRVRHLLVLASILCLMPITFAAWSQSKESQEKEGKTVTITGCIAKGEAADEFAITQNGKKYGLKSTKGKLADHLGHKVTVTGKFTRAPGEGEEGEKAEEGGGEYADVQVTSLKMISTSCQ
jgi:D-arabinose 1-dehydrogenase-like Zn-dependent alcohol dehydrogenase